MPVVKRPEPKKPQSSRAASYAVPIGEGFTTSSTKKPQSIGIIIGDGGSGKTTFVTRYCPGPIAFFNFDGRSSQAIDEARELRGEGIIQECPITFPFDSLFLSKERAMTTTKPVIMDFLKKLRTACVAAEQGLINLIAFDTGTELNDLFWIHARGDLETTKLEGERGGSKFIINRQWNTIYQMVKASGAHFIVIGRPKQKWVDNAPVKDSYIPYLPQVCDDLTDWTGRIAANVVPATRKTPAEVSFEIKISKAGPNITQLGRVYTSREWEDEGGPFAFISAQMYTKVRDKKVWMP